jgi:hypothetical protein
VSPEGLGKFVMIENMSLTSKLQRNLLNSFLHKIFFFHIRFSNYLVYINWLVLQTVYYLSFMNRVIKHPVTMTLIDDRHAEPADALAQ